MTVYKMFNSFDRFLCKSAPEGLQFRPGPVLFPLRSGLYSGPERKYKSTVFGN